VPLGVASVSELLKEKLSQGVENASEQPEKSVE
jgi:hypothetical protein